MNTESGYERKPNFESLYGIWKKRIEVIKQRTDIPKFPFGIKELDSVTHGITKGKVTLIAGRTSEAKTAFSLQAAFGVADKGATVLYITLEDDSGQIAERIFSNVLEVDNQELIRGKVDHQKLEDPAMMEIFKRVKFAPLQNYGHNFKEIKIAINSLDPKPDLVFLDYVQMIEQLPGESEYESLSKFSQQCKRFAEENNVGLVIVSQINRSGAKEGRPQAHHLQGCGRLEQISDLLLILYCPHNYDDSSFDYNEGTLDGKKIAITGMKECPPEYVELIIAKNKNGIRNFVVPLRFTGKYYKFEEWAEKFRAEQKEDWRTK